MTDRLDSGPVLEIIEHIYAAGVEPEKWPRVTELCQQLFPGCGFSLLLSNSDDELEAVSCGSGYDPKTVADYIANYHAINPYLPIIEALPSDEVARVRDHVTRDWLMEQPFYHEWLKPAGDFIHGVTMPIRSNGTGKLLRLTYDIPSTRSGAEDYAAEFLNRTKTHFRRAFEISSRLQHAGGSKALGQQLLDRIAGAAFVVTATAKITGMNHAALQLLRDAGVARAAPGDRLSFASSRAESRFQKLLLSVTTIDQAASPTAFLVEASGKQLPVIVLPLHSSNPLARIDTGRLALVQIGRGDPIVPPSDLLRSLYNLTRAEVAVVQRVTAGESIKDIAGTNDNSQSTQSAPVGDAEARRPPPGGTGRRAGGAYAKAAVGRIGIEAVGR